MAGETNDGIRTFSDAVALITGGASGIGAALGRALVARGAQVVLADRQGELADEVARGLGTKARAISLDVREAEAFAAVAQEVMQREGRIDYFFNNAGIGIGGPFEDHSLEDWRYIVDVTLLGVVYGISSVYPLLLKQGFGHIVNTASMAGRVAIPGLSAYCTTKHAVVGLSRSLRAEASGRGIRVSCFCPGAIRTEILQDGGVFGRFATGKSGTLQQEEIERARPMDVDAFAAAALARVAANDEIIILPRMWRIFERLDRLFPRFISAFSGRRFLAEFERMADLGEVDH